MQNQSEKNHIDIVANLSKTLGTVEQGGYLYWQFYRQFHKSKMRLGTYKKLIKKHQHNLKFKIYVIIKLP